jgi:hypothetical protein
MASLVVAGAVGEAGDDADAGVAGAEAEAEVAGVADGAGEAAATLAGGDAALAGDGGGDSAQPNARPRTVNAPRTPRVADFMGPDDSALFGGGTADNAGAQPEKRRCFFANTIYKMPNSFRRR